MKFYSDQDRQEWRIAEAAFPRKKYRSKDILAVLAALHEAGFRVTGGVQFLREVMPRLERLDQSIKLIQQG